MKPAYKSLYLALVVLMATLAADGLAQGDKVGLQAHLRGAGAAGASLCVELVLDIPAGVHVYSEADHFFKVTPEPGQGLGPARITLPATKTIPDLLSDAPDAKTQVLMGRSVVLLEYPVTGAEGERWRSAGMISFQACTEQTCFPPRQEAWSLQGTIGPRGAAGASVPMAAPAADSVWTGRSLVAGVAAAFLAGLLLSLTPCVYPMVGITLAVIGGRGASRRRTLWLTFVYVLGLSLVYALAGVLVAVLGSHVAGFLRSAWVLLPIGGFFLVMGLSMFDLFALETPSGVATRLQGLGKQGSAAGVFVMGAVSAFVVGPCVSGPLLSLVLFVAGSGRWLTGFLYFFALAWGMGAVLFVAGSAAALLPRAGAWMEGVKHALGMVLIWAAFYFTRPVIGETVYLAATLTCAGLALGVLGLFRVPEPGGRRLPGWLRLGAAAGLLFAAQFWLVLELRPPVETGASAVASGAVVVLEDELAKGKPVILDFWAPWCAICKDIERTVLARPDIQARLRDFNLVKVNYDTHPDLVRRFAIIGPPAYVFLDATGNRAEPVIVAGQDLQRRLLAGK